jgi:hypothetical protein
MAQPPDDFRFDLNDPNVILIGNQFFYYNPIDKSCIPLRDSIIDGYPYVDQLADASQQFTNEPASAPESQYSFNGGLTGSSNGQNTVSSPRRSSVHNWTSTISLFMVRESRLMGNTAIIDYYSLPGTVRNGPDLDVRSI